MGFGARVATAITEKNGGVITSSAGLKTAKNTWGQPAEWCDYSGTVDGQRVGITLMADPANFRPSWWHNRDYGLMVANPFGREAMKQGERSAVTVKRGQEFRLRFAAAIHAGVPEVSDARAVWHASFLSDQEAPAAETLTYKRVAGRELKLFVDKPAGWQSADKRPAILFFFGGGWVGGTPEQFRRQSEYLATRGMVGIRVEYRTIPKGDPGPPTICCADAKSAMRYVRTHAAELGLIPIALPPRGVRRGDTWRHSLRLSPASTTRPTTSRCPANRRRWSFSIPSSATAQASGDIKGLGTAIRSFRPRTTSPGTHRPRLFSLATRTGSSQSKCCARLRRR